MPRGDQGPVVVWRLGGALLAVEVSEVDQVVPVGPDGRARTRDGGLDVVTPPGIDAGKAGGATPGPERGHSPGHAVVVLAGQGPDRTRIAVAADHVEGVVEGGDTTGLETPPWLAALDSAHIRALVRIADGRVATLLHTATLTRGP